MHAIHVFKGFFTISLRSLYNTLRSECFSFARALAYFAHSPAFLACILVVASCIIKIVDMLTIQTQCNAGTFVRASYNVMCSQ